MKKIALLFLCFSCSMLFAQRVENVHAKQAGDRIYIYYDLISSPDYENFDVAILASVNDGSRIKLREVSGEVGQHIRPGTNKRVVWDVMEEVSDIRSVRFYVQAIPHETSRPRVSVHYDRFDWPEPDRYHTEIRCDDKPAARPVRPTRAAPPAKPAPRPEPRPAPAAPKKKKRKSRGLFVAYNLSKDMPYGGRIGRLAGIGSYMAVRVGNGAPGEDDPFSTGSFMVGPTLRLIKTRAVKIYAYGGLGIGRWYVDNEGHGGHFSPTPFPGSRPTSRPDQGAFATGLEYEWGGILTLGRLTFTGGVATLRDYESVTTLGIGFTFGKY